MYSAVGRGSSLVGIGTKLWVGQSEQKNLSLHQIFHTANTASNSMVTSVLSLVKRPEREVNHSPPSSAEIQNDWSYISAPFYVFMGKQENFNLTSLPKFVSHKNAWRKLLLN